MMLVLLIFIENLGKTTSNFTATNHLFKNESILYWRFEVVYTFIATKSSSALNFFINQPPKNGSCNISPSNGTTSTIFTIRCLDWIDEDGIKDYSVYGKFNRKKTMSRLDRAPILVATENTTQRLMLAYGISPRFDIRLPPSGQNNMSTINIIVQIRDNLNAITQYFLRSIVVTSDTATITSLVHVLQQANSQMTLNDPIMQLLTYENLNVVGQILTSVSLVMDQMTKTNLDKAASSKNMMMRYE